MAVKNKLEEDIDYVIFYAGKIKDNNLFFKQSKKFINSQLESSRRTFLIFGKGDEFKINARDYLKKIGKL